LFSFEVHTPYRRFFSDSVEALVLTLTDGEIAVYAGHSAFTAPVRAGLLKMKDKAGNWKTAFTAEGILEVKEHKTVLVSDAAEWPGEIDYERAKNARERAEETLLSGGMKFETDKAAASLRRAKMRMRVWEEQENNPVSPVDV
jgi:F-type H+-transporting ATPase subunit epsilon